MEADGAIFLCFHRISGNVSGVGRAVFEFFAHDLVREKKLPPLFREKTF